jgi:peptide/nickel transport system permease protein
VAAAVALTLPPGTADAAILAPPESTSSRRPAILRGRGLLGLILVGVILVLGLLAPLIAPYAPNKQLADANLLGPSMSHLFGTDDVNRDVFSRVLYGIRVDLLVIFLAVPIGALVGSALGLLSTLHPVADVTIQRLFDVVLAFPALILAIGLTAITGAGVTPIVAVVVAVEIPMFGRLLRSSTMKVRALPFVEAAEVMGASRWWVLRRHVLPNSLEPLLVQLALSMSVAVFVESAMSFIGIGVRPPNPSVGSVLADSIANLDANAMFGVGPLLVIGLLVLGFQLIAQAVGAARRQ